MLYRKTAAVTAATAALAALAAPHTAYAADGPRDTARPALDGSGECTFPMKEQFAGRPGRCSASCSTNSGRTPRARA